ncbi:unnamed protein product [Polarella glacialis]|uniref:Uncharacterized protein n=1 Tax=Polarella glacialis TaxID=89957 RepID=A0A813LLM2_POLGL|nr:unnamed protein product [Polarella glacialis]
MTALSWLDRINQGGAIHWPKSSSAPRLEILFVFVDAYVFDQFPTLGGKMPPAFRNAFRKLEHNWDRLWVEYNKLATNYWHLRGCRIPLGSISQSCLTYYWGKIWALALILELWFSSELATTGKWS